MWIIDFLIGRKQRVVVKESYSDCAPVISVVPQGSVLEPIMFILHQLKGGWIESQFLYMQKMRKFLQRSITPEEETNKLQYDLNVTSKWEKGGLM